MTPENEFKAALDIWDDPFATHEQRISIKPILRHVLAQRDELIEAVTKALHVYDNTQKNAEDEMAEILQDVIEELGI